MGRRKHTKRGNSRLLRLSLVSLVSLSRAGPCFDGRSSLSGGLGTFWRNLAFSQQDSRSKLGLVVSSLRQAGGAGQVSQLVKCLKAEFLKFSAHKQEAPSRKQNSAALMSKNPGRLTD